MRKAASRWEVDYARKLVNGRFERLRAASTIFYHPKSHMRVVVHGTESEVKKVRSKMCELYDDKVRGVSGSGKRDVREMEILGRNMRWTREGLEYEASEKKRQALLEGLGLSQESKMVKLEEIGREEDEEMLEGTEKTRFRSFAATLKYMSLDKSDVQDAAKEMCADTSKLEQSKKSCRYMREVETVTWVMRALKHDGMTLYVRVDSEFATGPERKSTSGGMMMISGTMAEHLPGTHASRAMSTAEAKYYAVITLAAEGTGMQSRFGYGQTPTQPQRLHQEEDSERPDVLN